MRGIYVERLVETDLDTLWNYTQTPKLHERWDVRFSRITYVQRALDDPIRCTSVANLPAGLRATGVVETTGLVQNDNGSRTSKISFWSTSDAAPIAHGTGYWRYVPAPGGVRFISYFEYQTRFGLFGRFANVFMRPIIGWATAHAIDALGLWLERDIAPERGWWRARASRCNRRPTLR